MYSTTAPLRGTVQSTSPKENDDPAYERYPPGLRSLLRMRTGHAPPSTAPPNRVVAHYSRGTTDSRNLRSATSIPIPKLAGQYYGI